MGAASPSNLLQTQPFIKNTSNQDKHPAITVRVGSQTQTSEFPKPKHLPRLRRYPGESERVVGITIDDLRSRYARLENMISVLDRVSYAISKPVAIVDAIKLFALAISSVLMSTLNIS